MSAIVYIPQLTMRRIDGMLVPTFDTSPAHKYGHVEVLMPGSAPRPDSQTLIAFMRGKLMSFCDDDFIVAAGEPAALAAAVLVASEINDGRIKLLRWDRHSSNYTSIQFDLKGEVTDAAIVA